MLLHETIRTSSNMPLPLIATTEILEGKGQIIVGATRTPALFGTHRFVIVDKLPKSRLSIRRQRVVDSLTFGKHISTSKAAWLSKRRWPAGAPMAGRAPQLDY